MIECNHVTKRYRLTTALKDISLTLNDDGIYCLLGRNGAGKTTLMKLIAGYIQATSGTIVVNDRTVTTFNMPAQVNFIESGADQFNLRLDQLIAQASRLRPGFDLAFAQRMISRFDLDQRKKYKQLSFGMKSMLSAIMGLANNSNVILMDEPTLGFDAIMRQQFNHLLLESYEAKPRVIVVSTHLIDEIAKVAEHLIVIDQGQVLFQSSLDDLAERAYSLTGPASAVTPLAAGLNCLNQVQLGSMTAAHIYDDRIDPPDNVTLEPLGLQDFFVNLVEGNTHAG